MTVLAYLISAVVSLLASLTVFMLIHFSLNYYTSLPWIPLLSTLTAAPLLVPFLTACHALIRKKNDQPVIRVHHTISGIYGLLICLTAVPIIAIDRDWVFGSTVVIAGVLIALPFFAVRLDI